jgi:hypothetical protein
MADRCPRCGAQEVALGKCMDWLHLGSATRFEPDGLRWLQPFRIRQSGVPLTGRFTVCLACGLVWAAVVPTELRDLIERYGSEEAKSLLPSAGTNGPE